MQSSDCNPHERWALEHSSETMAQPEDANNGFYRRLGKRLIDIVASLVGLVLLSPVLIAVSILVKCTSPGPILYWQDRVGRGEKMFRIAKFRSMVAGADKKGPSITSSGDARVTRLGAILRKFKLDEFPQLWNVLRGEMSLVGPRPPIPEEVRSYHRWQRRRLSMKPGLTCLWQVNGRNNIDFDRWMRMDLQYIDEWSPSLDLKILLRTIPAVLLGRGAS